MVEVTVRSTLPDTISIASKGVVFNQEVDYHWKPKGCVIFYTFNHNANNCPLVHPDQPKQKQEKMPFKQVKQAKHVKQKYVKKQAALSESTPQQAPTEFVTNEDLIDGGAVISAQWKIPKGKSGKSSAKGRSPDNRPPPQNRTTQPLTVDQLSEPILSPGGSGWKLKCLHGTSHCS